MPTTRETVLSALHALLQTQAAPVLRGEVLPERVPAAGLLILRDGEPGEPAVTLSPLRYHYQHRAEIEAVVQAGTGRDAAFDALAGGVGIVLAADRTLGGLCDWVEAEAPRPVDLAVEGAATLEGCRHPDRAALRERRSARLSAVSSALLEQPGPCCRGRTGRAREGTMGSGSETARSRGHDRIRWRRCARRGRRRPPMPARC